MVIEIPVGLPADIVPFAWLLGAWEGTGILEYTAEGHHYTSEFGQRITFAQAGDVAVAYEATAWLVDEAGEKTSELLTESGFWRLSRELGENDLGPALLPPRAAAEKRTADDVETLRTEAGFPIEASLARADGTLELYVGAINGPRIEIGTDAVVRAPGAKNYTAATRMYGLVQNHLLWAWDITAFGEDLKSHASARLAPVANADSWVPQSQTTETDVEPAEVTPEIAERAKVAAAKAKAKRKKAGNESWPN